MEAETIRSANRLCFPFYDNLHLSFRAPGMPLNYLYLISIHLFFIPHTQFVIYSITRN